MSDLAWMERNYLHDLAAEGRDARDAELRRPSSHDVECRCTRCARDEYNDTREANR